MALADVPISVQFAQAAYFVGAYDGPDKLNPSDDQKLQFYGWYKQAKEGDCSRPKPSMFAVTAGYQWAAWNKLRGMSKEDAMRHYVDGVAAIAPAWFKWEGLTTKYGGRSVPSLLAKAAERTGQTEEKKNAPGAGDRNTGEGEASAGGSDDLEQPRSPTDGKPTPPAEADDLDLTSAGSHSSADAGGTGTGTGTTDSKAALRPGDGTSTTPASGGAGGGSATPQQPAAVQPPQSAGFATPQRSVGTAVAPASAVSSTSVHSTVASAELLNNSLQKLRAITTDDAARVARLEQQLFALVQRARHPTSTPHRRSATGDTAHGIRQATTELAAICKTMQATMQQQHAQWEEAQERTQRRIDELEAARREAKLVSLLPPWLVAMIKPWLSFPKAAAPIGVVLLLLFLARRR